MTITTYTDREIALRQQLAAATQLAQLNGEIAAELKADKLALEAAIESSRKQERVGIVKQKRYANGTFVLWNKYPSTEMELFAAPVVAPDVLKDAERYRWLRDEAFNGFIVENMSVYPRTDLNAAIDAAMGGAND